MSAIYGSLEAPVHDTTGSDLLTDATLSIAISLKRIADMMAALNDTEYLVGKMVEITEAIEAKDTQNKKRFR